ncbi:hypothetical protein [Streptosporangium canum]|uniref:hypothetical protein n=1 Tax=Streptosporangium canum TaxID=324952 RepID=UPI0034442A1C
MSEITLNHAGPVDLDTRGRCRPGGRPGPRHPFRGRIPVRPLHADRDESHRGAAV